MARKNKDKKLICHMFYKLFGAEVELKKKKNGLYYCPSHKSDVAFY